MFKYKFQCILEYFHDISQLLNRPKSITAFTQCYMQIPALEDLSISVSCYGDMPKEKKISH